MASKPAIMKTIIKELKLSMPNNESAKASPIYEYVTDQYRKYTVTGEQYCKERQEMAAVASSYAEYLTAVRRQKELHEAYHAKKERSVKDTATMVGFKLPDDPR